MRAVLRRLSLLGFVLACFLAPSAAAGTVAIFYYPWYGTPSVNGAWLHWNQNGHSPPVDLYSRYYPANGPYSTADPIIVDQQMAEIAAAGIDEVVISWWGRGSQQDNELPMLLTAARNHHLQPAIHLEPYPGRSPASVAQDLPYLASLGIHDVFVYHPLDFASSDWATLQVPPAMRLFAGTPLVGFAAAGHFAGIYTYDFIDYGASKFARLCAEAHAHGLLCGPSLGPGYDGSRAGESSIVVPRRNGATYDHLWRAALAAHPDMVTITSFNEWGEGTQIEPAAPRTGYSSYDGAWGLLGLPAETAYLTRTAYWAGLFHSPG